MQSGICTKCQQAAVYEVVGIGDDGFLRIGMVGRIMLSHFICAECRFSEIYVVHPSERDIVKKKGQYIAPKVQTETL